MPIGLRAYGAIYTRGYVAGKKKGGCSVPPPTLFEQIKKFFREQQEQELEKNGRCPLR